MRLENEMEPITRRAFLGRTALGATTLLLAAPTLAWTQEAQAGQSLYSLFRFGLQSATLRNFTLEEALAKTQALGLKWWSGSPKHFPITDDPAVITEYKAKLKAHDIRMPAYGVLKFSEDEADARRKFAFAKAMHIKTLCATPTPDSLNLLDKLTEEYQVHIALYNNGPDDPDYGKWEKVLAAMEKHSVRIGACCDTGNYLRAGDTPQTAVAKFGPRLYALHLSNVKGESNTHKETAEIGALGGLLDTIGLFKNLRDIHYKGIVALAYDAHPDDPIPYIEQSLKALRRFLDPDEALKHTS